jgi:hypothetical protein
MRTIMPNNLYIHIRLESMESDNPYANRRDARKLGLLRQQKFRSRTRAKVAAGAIERVCGE